MRIEMNTETWKSPGTRATLHHGDALDVLKAIPDDSVEAVVTDPPYGIKFMGQRWDHGVPSAHVWAECLRVLKPGGHLLCFAGTRTQHRMCCAIEGAGFKIRDMIAWVYSTGFPKGHDVAWKLHQDACMWHGNMVEHDHGKEEVPGEQEAKHNLRFVRATYLQASVYACAKCGQVLQPRLPELSTQEHRAAWTKSELVWPEKSGVERRGDVEAPEGQLQRCEVCTMSHGVFADGAKGWLHNGTSVSDSSIPWAVADEDGSCPSYRPQSVEQLNREPDAIFVERRAQEIRGYNVALKPALEPITVACKPLTGTVAANVLEWGTAAINVDACRVPADDNVTRVRENGKGSGMFGCGEGGGKTVPAPQGRWPANLIHDGSDEVTKLLGSAARFYYCPKASKRDRDEGCDRLQDQENRTVLPSKNRHPTVKPTDLMRYLCRLVTPPGGIVLDPFMGSGSTGKAAMLEGFRFIGIEREPEYIEIARLRIQHAEDESALLVGGFNE